MKTAIVIPARYASKRLPGKPLLRWTGKYLIQHVYERACGVAPDVPVVIATDDPRILAAVESFGGRAALTRRDHPSGTDRVAEVARGLDADVIVNVQGDEPLVDPAALAMLPRLLEQNRAADMATLAAPLSRVEDWQNPNCVKVVCDVRGRALYFSRSPIPFVRDGRAAFDADPPVFLQHLGIYAYHRAFLLDLAAARPEQLETLEKLEQLRVLARGGCIQVGIVRHAAVGVDTLEDYRHFVRIYRQEMRGRAA